MTPEVVPLRVIMVNVPATPTDDFLGKERSLDDNTILRWVTVFRYPDGVSVAEGDDWFVNVHAPEVMRQPGLTRFFSYRVIPSEVPVQKGVSSFLHPRSEVSSNWHRVSEMWYENGDGWAESIITSPAGYSKPLWAASTGIRSLSRASTSPACSSSSGRRDDWLREVPRFYVWAAGRGVARASGRCGRRLLARPGRAAATSSSGRATR